MLQTGRRSGGLDIVAEGILRSFDPKIASLKQRISDQKATPDDYTSIESSIKGLDDLAQQAVLNLGAANEITLQTVGRKFIEAAVLIRGIAEEVNFSDEQRQVIGQFGQNMDDRGQRMLKPPTPKVSDT
jgi:hypothetical protein